MVREGGLPRWPRGRVGDIFVYPSRHAEDGQIRKWWRGDHALSLYNTVVKGEKKKKNISQQTFHSFEKIFNLPRHFQPSLFTETIIQNYSQLVVNGRRVEESFVWLAEKGTISNTNRWCLREHFGIPE